VACKDFTINPSVPFSIASSRNSSIKPGSRPVFAIANVRKPLNSWIALYNASRRSFSVFFRRLRPSLYKQSNANACTCTSDSSLPSLASLRLLWLSDWNGKILSFFLSYATTSASTTASWTPSRSSSGAFWATSLNFPVWFSKLRLYTLALPSCKMWICARSPSYLSSHVNASLPNVERTSFTPFVGFASIGTSGAPSWKPQCLLSS